MSELRVCITQLRVLIARCKFRAEKQKQKPFGLDGLPADVYFISFHFYYFFIYFFGL